RSGVRGDRSGARREDVGHTGSGHGTRRTSCKLLRVRSGGPRSSSGGRPYRAIGAVVARFLHTEEVTGSNPVSPTTGSSGPRHADVAQLVEHHLAKVRVAGSNPVVRSGERRPPTSR